MTTSTKPTPIKKRDDIINPITWKKIKTSLQTTIDNLTLSINIGPHHMKWCVSQSGKVLHSGSMIPVGEENLKWAKYHAIIHARRIINRS